MTNEERDMERISAFFREVCIAAQSKSRRLSLDAYVRVADAWMTFPLRDGRTFRKQFKDLTCDDLREYIAYQERELAKQGT